MAVEAEVVETKEEEIIAEVEVIELVEQIEELTVQEPVVEVEVVQIEIPAPAVVPVHVPEVTREIISVQVQEMVQEVPKAFLKMGKWEAPHDTSSFQFGSFGQFSSANDEISLPVSTPWGGVVAETSDLSQQGETAGVWGANGGIEASASSSSGPSPLSSLFPAPKGLPSVPSDISPSGSSSQQGRYDQKPLAPPGLDPHPHTLSKPLPARQDSRTAAPGQAQSRGKHEANQQLQQQQLQQQQYQYPQPAAVPTTPARGAPASAAMPYGYAPGFEPQAQYQPPYQPAPVMPVPAAGSSPVAVAGAPAAQQASAAPQSQQQGQLQYGPPPGMPNHYANPYYGNPYYGNPAYFYGQPQVPNPYYNQQARDYQASRPYGSDPYAPGVQYPVYQQGGGFPDASGSYPGMPMQHPSMGTQGQGAAAAPAATAGPGKQQKGVGASSAVQQQQQQDPNQGYGYNHYNPRDAPWQYQQAAQGWGAPMMGFPVGPGQSPPSQGFSQGQPPQQSAGGQRPSASYGGPPGQHGQGQGQGQQHQPQGQQGQGQGQSFSRGPTPNAAGPSSGGSHQQW